MKMYASCHHRTWWFIDWICASPEWREPDWGWQETCVTSLCLLDQHMASAYRVLKSIKMFLCHDLIDPTTSDLDKNYMFIAQLRILIARKISHVNRFRCENWDKHFLPVAQKEWNWRRLSRSVLDHSSGSINFYRSSSSGFRVFFLLFRSTICPSRFTRDAPNLWSIIDVIIIISSSFISRPRANSSTDDDWTSMEPVFFYFRRSNFNLFEARKRNKKKIFEIH